MLFRSGEKPILENANFRFEKGGKYALTGPSGCGKSTLLKLLLGWLPDYTGTIRFDKKDAKDFTSDQLHQQMSYIEQNVFLFNNTIRDNITLGEDFTDELIDRAVMASALAGDLANMPLGLDTPVGEDGSNLSGGQKQRVAIAGIIAMRPRVIIFDESTAMLDPIGRKSVIEIMEKLNREENITVINITHYMEEAARADRVIVINDGEMIMDGTPKEVFSEVDLLHRIGLESPQSTELVNRLSGLGLDVDLYAIGEEECIETIYNALVK